MANTNRIRPACRPKLCRTSSESPGCKYETRSKYMDGCKQARLHPGTGLPLTQKDREEAPWLFPDGQKDKSFHVTSNKDADDDIDGNFPEPNIDDGDGPPTGIKPVQKTESPVAHAFRLR